MSNQVHDCDDAEAQKARWNTPPKTLGSELERFDNVTDNTIIKDGDDDGDDAGYGSLTKAELNDIIDERNADRDEDDKIVPESNKNADLIAALEADDEAAEENDDDD